ncbi:MAG: sulfatase [Planctomycetaceae bacterium]|jgi:arylsulfatase A-like enzyme|nr:sulfatase [Planctomycetaceae bacterium]MBT6484584.1 sulfatase [Planctomycetaceae bacterium]MBT6495636.1 sulfatase [Planctomycetaceae bacterium]
MNRLPTFFPIAAVLLAAFLSPTIAADQPNVLFIAVDDLNDWIGCLGGHPDCKSPNIDALARRGMLFTHSYCAVPACNPSRAALMTGIRPWTSGVYQNSQPWRPAMPKAVTLPQHFMANGYQAVGSGKIYHGRYPDPPSWHNYLSKGADPKPSQAVLADPRSRAGGVIWGVLDVDDSKMDDHKMVDYAVEYLKQKHEKPFFLACGLFRPHMPWQVPRKYYDMYPPEKITLPDVPANDLDDVPTAGVKMARPKGDHATMLRTGNWRHAVQAYLASISFADAEVGRLMKALDASPYSGNTIVVLWGDHGWHLGEKSHWRKFALWEEATRAPLIMVAPGITKPGSVCRRTVDFMHIYPTLAELCGLPIGDQLEGRSMLPLLKNPAAEWKLPAITTHGRNNHAVRSERWRYIRYANGDEELYDHDADPMEWKNLASKSQLAKVKRELAAWLPKKNAANAPFDKRSGRRRTKKKKTP